MRRISHVLALDDERNAPLGPDAWHLVHGHDVAVCELGIRGELKHRRYRNEAEAAVPLPGERSSASATLTMRRIAPVPFIRRNLKEDLEDLGSRFDGSPDLEFRLATEALELEQSGLSYQRVPPGYRFPYGHTHETQEEVYIVLRGSGRMKLDDEIVELNELDAVRVPPGTWRGYEAGPKGLEIIVIGAPSLGKARREDVEGQRDWWTE